jgi:tetratricopeptide (TPR) repeat protein
MDAERWQRLRQIFDEVIETDSGHRRERIDALCGSDLELRDEILRLLTAADTPHAFVDSPAAALLAPTLDKGIVLAGRFELVAPLGRGGMGEVWHAYDRELREDVAIKTMTTSHLGDSSSIERFKREIQLARRVAHPNICRVYDLFEDTSSTPSRVFLTMERLEGETLAQRMKRAGSIPRDEAIRLFRQITAGVAAAHRAGVVHRDLKPANVMLTTTPGEQRAVVMDFGLARAPSVEGDRSHTTIGAIIGTPEYMAPEQIKGAPATPATDVYALGLLLFEMLSGAQPYASGTTLESWMRRAREGPGKLSGVVPGVQRRIDHVIARCVEYEPARRFEDAGQIVSALESPWPAVVAQTRRPIVAAAVLAGAASVVFALFTLGHRLLPVAAPPAEARQWFDEAQQALAEGASVRAWNGINRAVELAPGFAAAHAALSEILLELDMPGRAQEAMLRATEVARDRGRLPGEEESYLDGVQHLLLRRCDAAIASLQKVAETVNEISRPYRLIGVARAMERCARMDDAEKTLDEVVRLDPRNAAALLHRARLLARRRQYGPAVEALTSAESLFRARNNSEGLGEVLTTRATFDTERDRLDEAARTLDKAGELARGIDDVRQRVRILLQQAIVRRKLGDLATANTLTSEAIDVARRQHLETLTLDGLFAAANVHVVQRQPAEARTLIERALAIAETYRHEDYQARAHLSLASVLVTIGEPARAEQEITAARPHYERIGHTRNLALADTLLGQVRLMRAEYVPTIALFAASLAAARRSGDVEQEAIARENLATAQAGAGQYPQALEEYQGVVEMRRAAGRKPVEAFALLNVADLSSRLGRFQEATDALARTRQIETTNPDLLSRQYRIAGLVALREGRFSEAVDASLKARTLTDGVSIERTIRSHEQICVAEAYRGRRLEAHRACDALLADQRLAHHVGVQIETRLSAGEAYLMLGESHRALTTVREVEPLISGLSEHHERWKLLAIAAAADGGAAEARDRLTRELDRLRLQWGDAVYEGWARRADTRTLLAKALRERRR